VFVLISYIKKCKRSVIYCLPKGILSQARRNTTIYSVYIFRLLYRRPGPALSRCNRCGCIELHASGNPAPWRLGRLFIFARYSLRSRIVERLI